MKKIILSITAIMAIIISSTAQQDADSLHHTTSWQALLQEAEQQNKLIFIDCYFTGCHPCAMMDKEVFPNELVRKELKQNFIGVKIDVFKEPLGDSINLKYGITGFPTFLILNPKGMLITQFSGYKDPGLLLAELKAATRKAPQQQWLTGFNNSMAISYPDFYVKYYDRKDRKSDPVAANAWIKSQKDWTREEVAMAIFRTRPLDTEVEEYVLKNYNTYLAKYGENLLLNKASDLLSARLTKELELQAGEPQFRKFTATHAGLFPASHWKVLNFMLGYRYYGSIEKDTLKLLQFVNEDPLVYVNYMGALYSSLLGKKQLNETNLKLLCEWAEKAVNEECALDMIRTAAYMHKNRQDMDGFRKYIDMAISKSKKYNMPTDELEKIN